jgi:MoaA/NifB/PqqE/SkfB family radical SAM enzyme/outer membrane lipoprotein-sorting protein
MSGKFIARTFRNVISRQRPYFAHLALTHRCNLRCRFCHVQDSKFDELDTAGMKRVIDVLDDLGVAVVSISGGGEPLLRSDFVAIIDYAASKGMYTKITSNGTMPRAKYEQLLGSRINEIGISLDGVRGHDLPFSHVGEPILRTLRYLNDHLPPGRTLTINVTVSEVNREQVDEIVDYCAREFRRARVWLNPVVVGKGSLRTATPAPVGPDCLRRSKSPTLLSAEFYARGVEEQHRRDVFDWGCLAGQLFFDVKPNGDFWLCQDQPSPTPLNLLDSDFPEKLRAADVSARRKCSGCTYSCYYVVQKGFEPRHWRDMATLWWKAHTNPDDRCVAVAEKYGWVAGLCSFLFARLPLPSLSRAFHSLLLLVLGVLILSAGELPQATGAADVLQRMEQANAQRQQRLMSWTSIRRYRAENTRLRRWATATAEMRYTAPGAKTYTIIDRGGSKIIVNRVIEPLLAAERDNARPDLRAETDVSRKNYDFRDFQFDPETSSYVFEALPKKAGKYNFRGRVWIDAGSYGIRRLEGEPARPPSFWIRSIRFVHEYARFGDFWLPVRNRTDVQLRIFGHSALDIEYSDHHWQGVLDTQESEATAQLTLDFRFERLLTTSRGLWTPLFMGVRTR